MYSIGRLARGAILALLTISVSCVQQSSRPQSTDAQQPSDPPKLTAINSGIQGLAASLPSAQIWFRVERPGVPAVELAVRGRVDERVGLGSISKSVTAIGIALLIQQGKLRLDTKLADVLNEYFVQHGAQLDQSLRDITIERLLTHTAGLRPNGLFDREHGISEYYVTTRIAGDNHFFKDLVVANAGKSNGSTQFAYSNFSYIILGMVIEAVSGQSYEDFCQQNILEPIGVADAVIPADWRIFAPMGGWEMTLADVLRVRAIFDVGHPTILTKETLERTLLGHLGRPLSSSGKVYYTLGTYVRQDTTDGPYVLDHDGITAYYLEVPAYFMYVETFDPGGESWVIAIKPAPPRDQRREILREVRAMLAQVK